MLGQHSKQVFSFTRQEHTHQITPRKVLGYGWKHSTDTGISGRRISGSTALLGRFTAIPMLAGLSASRSPILFTEASGCGSGFRIRSPGSVAACLGYLLEHRRPGRINQLCWETGRGEHCGFQQQPGHKDLGARAPLISFLGHASRVPPSRHRAADSRPSCARNSHGQGIFRWETIPPGRQLPGQEADLGQTRPTENVWCSGL